ncbi:hypothetical protein QBC46DRAFT_309163 [Diplogelasinospora grovesii]|uniref:Zn(2)-C6 fungal-type domain-containing protein n=1 Tax=Diplogelasinospora grovesii TaxID=303347 RepID=A0AAN6NB72_9PEZI|nr:hypothetical protein QBC46DRAFT_309163 [Diplogelasinospora grovesii]
MGQDTRPITCQNKNHPGKAKVKTGCRTCKIRKVKCDEGRPACRRCIATGRVCDGYGIWGGGGNSYAQRQHSSPTFRGSSIVTQSPALQAAGKREKNYFEWFKRKTVPKLQGSFASNFWNTLLLQASQNEPAVLHTIIALSSIHMSGHDDVNCINAPNDAEQFMLHHYIKAISHLQPHFSNNKDRASIRVALITCVLFVSLELLRGHFESAQIHLQNGLRVLGEAGMLFDGNAGVPVARLKASHEPTDDWIVEAFSRLHIQFGLFVQAYQHPCLDLLPTSPAYSTPNVFCSINDAWQQLEHLLNMVFYLSQQARQQTFPEQDPTLLAHAQQLRMGLSHWLEVFEAFLRAMQSSMSEEEEMVFPLLRAYHTMTGIMTEACLFPGDESVFDLCADKFVLLINQLAQLWKMSSASQSAGEMPGSFDMSKSIVDLGWIPPLYYTATKCRVHRIRAQAIRLLECTSHREGIWDANTAACAARKVVQIEERDFYTSFEDAADEFELLKAPSPEDLELPTLPDSYRLRDVEVVLSGTPMDKILLYCTQQGGGNCKVLIAEYGVRLQAWKC